MVESKKNVFSAWGVPAIYLLAFVGGITALAHQLLWTRRMIDLMGASAGSAARVFGCFFLGLALGAWVGALLAARVRRPWRWLGAAEWLIALLALPMLWLPAWSDGLWPWLGPDRLTGWPGASLKTVLSILLVLPPAAMMGLFLPLAVRDWPTREAKRSDPGVWVYAINTVGAVAGILIVTAFLLPRWSLVQVMWFAVLCNVAAGIGCWLVDALLKPAGHAQLSAASGTWRGTLPDRPYLWMAAWSGLLVMAAEVIALLMTQLLAPLSFYAPAAVLAAFIAMLALAAFVVASGVLNEVLERIGWSPWLIATGLLMVVTPFLFHGLAPLFPLADGARSLSSFLFRLCVFVLLVFGPAIFAAGLWFPLLAVKATASADATHRLRWGWLLAANGVGGLIGAESAHLVLLPFFGPHQGLGVLGFTYLIAAWVCLSPQAEPHWRWALRGAMTAAVVLLFTVLPRLHSVHPALAPGIIAERHGREGSLVILDNPQMGRAMLLQNQYMLGASAGRAEAERQAHIPLLLHPAPSRVAFIGLATGITAGGALAHDAVGAIEAVEISRAVKRAAHEWFEAYNRGVMTHPRARIVVEDGRTWLAAHENAFDVIVSDLFLPWGPGEGRLYTVEHFAAARRALRPDGLFMLWLPMYQLNNDQFMVILNTFLQVFPEADLFMRETANTAPVVGLVGGFSEEVDWNVVAQRIEAEADGLDDTYLATFERLQSLYMGRAHQGLVAGPVNTLDNLWIELDAGRLRVLHGEAAPYLQGERWARWRDEIKSALDAGP